MGGSPNGWLPYVVGALIGHFVTIGSWISSLVVDSVIRGPSYNNTKPLEPWDHHLYSTFTWTTTSSSVSGSVGGIEWLYPEKSGLSGVYIWILAILAIIGGGCSLILGLILVCQQRAAVREVEPLSPSLRDLARSQLAEIRLRRHGIGGSIGSP